MDKQLLKQETFYRLMGSQTVQLCATCRVGLTQSVYPTIYISLSPSNTWYTRSDGLATLAWWLGHNLLDPQRSDFQGPDSQLSNQVPGLILVIWGIRASREVRGIHAVHAQQTMENIWNNRRFQSHVCPFLSKLQVADLMQLESCLKCAGWSGWASADLAGT